MRFFGPPNIEKLKARQDLKGLTRVLIQNKDPVLRRAAAEALGQLGGEDEATALVVALQDRDKEVGRAAEKALIQIGEPAAGPLVASLKSSSGDEGQQISRTLVEIGAPAVDWLITALKHGDRDLRLAAAAALGQIGAPAEEPLRAIVADAGTQQDVRRAASNALDKIQVPHPTSVSAVTAAFARALQKLADEGQKGMDHDLPTPDAAGEAMHDSLRRAPGQDFAPPTRAPEGKTGPQAGLESGQGAQGWETVHVFISSTFNDMHAERDYLVKQVFPELREWCEERKLRLVDIDLRWGVTEQDALHNKKVVRVCLDRIDYCRPFFLCFLGQRRGWVPSREEISEDTFEAFPDLGDYAGTASITEMEILHALLNPLHQSKPRDTDRPAESYEPAAHAYFYLRDPSYLHSLPDYPPILRETYTNEWEKDPVKRARQNQALKNWREVDIPDSGRPVRDYSATWDAKAQTTELLIPLECPSKEPASIARWQRQWDVAGVRTQGRHIARDPAEQDKAHNYNRALITGRLADLVCQGQPLSEVVLKDLKAAIAARFPDHVGTVAETDLQKEIDQQEQYLFAASEGFVERGDDFAELNAYAAGDSDQVFVLTAPAGMGKSALLAKWVEHSRAEIEGQPGATIHARFIGASERSTTVYSLLRFLLREIKEIHDKLDEGIPSDPQELRLTFARLLQSAGERGKTVIVIDGLNQLESGLTDLGWLPWQLPPNVKLVVSFKQNEGEAGELYQRLSSNGQAFLAEVRPFDSLDHRRMLVEVYLAQYLKALDERHLEALIRTPGAENPLYLKVVLSELRVFGAFANLGQKIRSDFGNTPASAFQGVLERLETDPAYTALDPSRAVPLLFGLLAHSRRGLSVKELAAILCGELGLEGIGEQRQAVGDPIHHFLRQVRPFLARREGRYGFFFESFQAAAQGRYVAAEGDESRPKRQSEAWHLLLANYFEAQELGHRKIDELPWQLMKASSWQRLYELLAGLSFFEAAWEANRDEVKAYWAQVEGHTSLRMADAYRSVVEAPERHHAYVLYLAPLLYGSGYVREAQALREYLVWHSRQTEDSRYIAESLGNLAQVLMAQGDVEGALAHVEEQERICREIDYQVGLKDALGNRAIILYSHGALEQAMALQKEKEALCQALGDQQGLAHSLSAQATILQDQGALDAALELHQRHERLCRTLQDREGIAASLGNQANTLVIRTELKRAMALSQQQGRIYRELGNKEGLASSLGTQATILYKRGDLSAAMALHQEEEQIIRQLGHKELLAYCLGNQALILNDRGDPDAALARHKEEEQLYREVGHRDGLQRTLGNQANILWARGDLDRAEALHTEEIRLCRELGNQDALQGALGNQALVLQARGELGLALVLHQDKERICRELQNRGGLAIALYNQAVLWAHSGQLDEARPRALEAYQLAKDQGLDTLAGRIGSILERMDQAESNGPAPSPTPAREAFRHEEEPEDAGRPVKAASPGDHYELGVAYGQQGRVRDAMREYQAAVRIDPDHADAHCNLGVLYAQLDRWADAVPAFEAALRINPEDSDLRSNLGVAYTHVGRMEDAIREHKAVTELNPASPQAHVKLGRAYGQARQPAEAAAAFKRALDLDPESADAHNDLGVAYEDLGCLEEALGEYQAAAYYQPDHPRAWRNMAIAYRRQLRREPTPTRLPEPLRAEAEAHYERGVTYFERRQRSAAVDELKMAVEIDPGHAGAHYHLALIAESSGETEAAIEEYRTTLAIDERHERAHYGLGAIYTRHGRTDLARGELRTATRLGSEGASRLLARVEEAQTLAEPEPVAAPRRRTARPMTLGGHTNRVNGCAFSPDGELITSASDDRTVRVWDAFRGKEVRILKGAQDGVFDCDFSPDGEMILAPIRDKAIMRWETKTGLQYEAQAGCYRKENQPTGLDLTSAEIMMHRRRAHPIIAWAHSAEWCWIVTTWGTSMRDEVKIWHATTGEEIATLAGHEKNVGTCVFSLGNRFMATAAEDMTARVWDTTTWTELARLSGDRANIPHASAFSPDSRWLASGVRAHPYIEVKVWDLQSKEEISTLVAEMPGIVRTCAFSPDGQWVVAGFGQTLQVWDVETGETAVTLEGHTGDVTDCVFSPDSRRIASASEDRTVRVWDLGAII